MKVTMMRRRVEKSGIYSREAQQFVVGGAQVWKSRQGSSEMSRRSPESRQRSQNTSLLLQFTQTPHGLLSFSSHTYSTLTHFSHTYDSLFPHLLHPDSLLSRQWLIVPTPTPLLHDHPYCTFTIYTARILACNFSLVLLKYTWVLAEALYPC